MDRWADGHGDFREQPSVLPTDSSSVLRERRVIICQKLPRDQGQQHVGSDHLETSSGSHGRLSLFVLLPHFSCFAAAGGHCFSSQPFRFCPCDNTPLCKNTPTRGLVNTYVEKHTNVGIRLAPPLRVASSHCHSGCCLLEGMLQRMLVLRFLYFRLLDLRQR